MKLKREDVARVVGAGGRAAEEQALALFDLVGDLTGRVEALERRAGRNSRNSSMPPSTDRACREDKGAKDDGQREGKRERERGRGRSGRKRGAQDGHEGHGRGLIGAPDETVEHRPERCRKCGRALTGEDRAVGRPARHQVIELPDTIVVRTEHRPPRGQSGCRSWSCAT